MIESLPYKTRPLEVGSCISQTPVIESQILGSLWYEAPKLDIYISSD